MTAVKIPNDLQVGAICLYNSSSLVDKAIEFKEGDPDTAHVEVYIGGGKSVASRNGIGVGQWDFRPAGLVHVRQPVRLLQVADAMDWFTLVNGAKYGWGDIGANLDLVERPEDLWTKPELLRQTGVDCSHFAAMFLAVGGCPQFDEHFDYRKITPRDFKIVMESIPVWDVATAATKFDNAPACAGTVPVVPDLSPREEGEQIKKS